MELQHIFILIWISIALGFGIGEGFLFNYYKRHLRVFGCNIHGLFTLFRAMLAAPIIMSICLNIGVLEAVLFSFIFMLVFPFFHDGAYYTTRELLKKGTYPRYWIDQSSTTDAAFSVNFVIRTVLLIVAALIFPY